MKLKLFSKQYNLYIFISCDNCDCCKMPLIMKSSLDRVRWLKIHFYHTCAYEMLTRSYVTALLATLSITFNFMLVVFFCFSLNELFCLTSYDAYDRFSQCLQINYSAFLRSFPVALFVSFSFTLFPLSIPLFTLLTLCFQSYSLYTHTLPLTFNKFDSNSLKVEGETILTTSSCWFFY